MNAAELKREQAQLRYRANKCRHDLAASERVRRELAEALREVGNAYGCYAGCTGALPGAPVVGSHHPSCAAARAALAASDALEEGK